MLRMELLEAFARDVRIDGRRRDVGVPEQELDDAKIGAVVEKMRREGVSKHVRRERSGRDAGARGVALDQQPERLARERTVARERLKRLHAQHHPRG